MSPERLTHYEGGILDTLAEEGPQPAVLFEERPLDRVFKAKLVELVRGARQATVAITEAGQAARRLPRSTPRKALRDSDPMLARLRGERGMLGCVLRAIRAHTFSCTTEAQLQEALAQVFDREGLPADREEQLTPTDRIDFLVDDVGVEVKIDGSSAEIARQLSRYAQSDRVRELLLVTTRQRHHHLDGATFNAKPVRVVRVGGVL